MASEADLLEDWRLGNVIREIEYCQHCQQQTRCGVIRFDDGTDETMHAKHFHRDGSRADLFRVGARVARRKDSEGLSVVSVLLQRHG